MALGEARDRGIDNKSLIEGNKSRNNKSKRHFSIVMDLNSFEVIDRRISAIGCPTYSSQLLASLEGIGWPNTTIQKAGESF